MIHFTINDQLFLETLLTEIRGKTISYASYRKKENNKLENCFVEDIMKLENELHTTETFDLIEKKKSDLNILRQEKCGVVISDQKCSGLKRGKGHHFFIDLETKKLQIKLFLNLLMNLKM